MSCKSCKKAGACNRHKRKVRASSHFVPNLNVPPPYGFTEEAARPDLIDICSEKAFSFAGSNLGNNVLIGTEVGVRHRIIVTDNNNSVKLDATFRVGTAFFPANITIGNPSMIVAWFEDDAIVVINPSEIISQSSGTMQHFVEYNSVWSVNIDTTLLQRWQVDFVYNPPIVVVGQPNSLWVDDGCSIEFAAQNNTDERPIESALQNNIELTPTVSIPTNKSYTSNPILLDTTINIAIGVLPPQYTAKSQGSEGGYAKVEWGGNTFFVPAGTQASYTIPEGELVKTTWYNVNPATLLPESSKLNLNLGNYKFAFARFVSALFIDDLGLQIGAFILNGGSSVVGIDDENGIAKARSFSFTMPNKNINGTITFRDIELLCDYDFENPFCVDNAITTVSTIKDRLSNTATFTQPNLSLQPSYVSNGVKCTPGKRIGGFFSQVYDTIKASFIIGKIDRDANPNLRTLIGGLYANITITSAYDISSLALFESILPLGSYFLGTWWQGLGNGAAGATNFFPLRTSPKALQPWVMYSKGFGLSKIQHNNTGTEYDVDLGSSGVNFRGGFELGNDGMIASVDATFFRVLAFNEQTTEAENLLLLSKIREKYNIT